MIIISHRGNVDGPNLRLENVPECILSTLHYFGFDVEVDVWLKGSKLFLGHDAPLYEVTYSFIRNKHLWIHCKNEEALVFLSRDRRLNIFSHKEGIAITSKGYLFSAPGSTLCKKSIAVMPEIVNDWDISVAYGICTDYPLMYKK